MLIVVGFGLGNRAGCVAGRFLNRPARYGRGFVPQRGMRSNVVVVVTPQRQLLAGIGEAVEYLIVQAFVAQAAVEAFDQPVLLRMRRIRKQSGGLFSRRLAGVDIVLGHAGIARPFKDRGAGELGAIIADNAVGFAVNPDHRRQLPRHARTREACIGNQPQILTGAIIVDRQNAELARRTEGVRYNIQ